MCESMDKSCLTSLFHQIDDCNFKKLKDIFNFTGRGRRPSIPKVSINNKLLLQLFYLKDEKKTWDDIVEFASNFITINQSRIRYLIEKAHTNATLHINDSDRFQTFLMENLTFVGNYLSCAGVTRDELLSSNLSGRSEIIALTNGIILDLVTFQKKELLQSSWVCQAAEYLSGRSIDRQFFGKQLKKIQATSKNLSKSRHRNNNYEDFMKADYCCQLVSADISTAVVKSSPGTPKAATSASRKILMIQQTRANDDESNLENSPLLSGSKTIQIKKLKGEMEDMQKKLKEEQDKVQTIKDVLSQKILSFHDELQQKNEELRRNKDLLSSLQQQYEEIQIKLESTLTILQQRNQELSKIRHSAFYKRLKRWESRLSKKEKVERMSDQILSKQIFKLKLKLKKTQTLLSNSKKLHKKSKEEKKKNELKIQQMKFDFLNQAEKRNVSMKEHNSNRYTKDVIKCVIELIGQAEVSGKNCGKIIDIVARHIFHTAIDSKDLPSERSSLRYADKGHVLAKQQIAETLLQSSNVDLHSDGTTRNRQKIVGHQLSTDSGQLLSCGFTSVFKEDSDTLVDVAFNLLQELADLYTDSEVDAVFRSMLQNLTGLMSDRASVMKSFDKAFNIQRMNTLGIDENMEFLHCNAHFLLGLSSESEKVLRKWEQDLNEKIGRDGLEKFKRFSSSSENAAYRFIRTACDVLGPRGDEKNGCRASWEAYCHLQSQTSSITSFRGNRFNNLFQAAASLHYHRNDIVRFFQDFMASLNLKQESVLHDARSDSIDCAMVALGLLYHKVTGPYWILLSRQPKYLDFFCYVVEMNAALGRWEHNAEQLTDANFPPLFSINLNSPVFSALYKMDEQKKTIVQSLLHRLCSAYKDVLQRQLTDFLPGGRYYDIKDEKKRQQMQHSQITNLIGEECFGDLDFSIFKRRHASLHHHSTINMLKKNKTSIWLDSKSEKEQVKLLGLCGSKSKEIRIKHQAIQKVVLQKRRQQLEKTKQEKEKNARKQAIRKSLIIERVKTHGGPCFSEENVTQMLHVLGSRNNKLEALKDEIRFQKIVLGNKSEHLKLDRPLELLASHLKAFLNGTDLINDYETLLDKKNQKAKQMKKVL